MKKTKITLIVLVLGIGILYLISDELFFGKTGIEPGTVVQDGIETPVEELGSYVVEEVVGGLEIPWGVAFTSPDRMLVTERPGRLRQVKNGQLVQDPLHVFDEVSSTGEEGLMSVLADPQYEQNRWIYLSYAYLKGEDMKVKVVRFRDEGVELVDELVVIDNVPAARFHAGCRLGFGPDGKLYITTGDALERDRAQELEFLGGKVLRVNRDGSIPADNPFEGSPVWSLGHRNSQGIDWHPETGELYSSEHGPSVFDGPSGGDEINRIVKGGNYGWPLVSHDESAEGLISPLIQFTPPEPPASLLVYSGRGIPSFKNNLFFGSLRGEGLMRLELDPEDPDRILLHEKLKEVNFGRIREVMEGPDGFIYFTTSNQDGRGSPAQNDDRIFRIRPL